MRTIAYTLPWLGEAIVNIGNRKWLRDLSAGLCLLVALLLHSGEATALEANIDRINVSQVPTVKAYVTVLDSTGDTVKGLREEAFSISDQLVRSDDSQPLDSAVVRSALESGESLGVVLLIDRSGSMSGSAISDAQSAASEFVSRLGLTDKAAVLSFSTTTKVECDPTSDMAELQRRIGKISIGGDTALYDAAKRAVQVAADMSDVTRRTVILLTDGKRTAGSIRSPDPVSDEAEEGNVRIFTIGLGREPDHEALRGLARSSHGAHYEAASSSDLMTIYQKIADRLQNQYVVEFQQEADVNWHKLSVTVKHEGQTASDSMKYWPHEVPDTGMAIKETEPGDDMPPPPSDDGDGDGDSDTREGNDEEVEDDEAGPEPDELDQAEQTDSMAGVFEDAPRWMVIATIVVAALAIALLAAIVVVLIRRR